MSEILLIDDSSFQRNRVAKILSENGFSVHEAKHGKEGIEKISVSKFDLVVLDLLMPELDGFGVLESLRSKGIEIPVIVLTADIQQSQRERCLSLGANLFLNKPPNAEVLVNSIRQLTKAEGDISAKPEAPTLTAVEKDALGELINIGVGRAASVLNDMVESHVVLTVPSVKIVQRADVVKNLAAHAEDNFSLVRLGFEGGLNGSASLLFPMSNAAKLVSLLVNERDGDAALDSVRESTLTEVGNIVLNSVMGSIGNTCEEALHYKVPVFARGSISNVVGFDPNAHQLCIVANTVFNVQEHQIEGEMILLFEVTAFRHLMRLIGTLS